MACEKSEVATLIELHNLDRTKKTFRKIDCLYHVAAEIQELDSFVSGDHQVRTLSACWPWPNSGKATNHDPSPCKGRLQRPFTGFWGYPGTEVPMKVWMARSQ